MRTVLEEEEEEREPSDLRSDSEEDRELTISATTLLAIFFGLVLICGVFFGLGYTLGRRAPAEATPTSSTQASIAQSFESQPKPSAAQADSVPAAASTAPASDADAPDTAASQPAPQSSDAPQGDAGKADAAEPAATPQSAVAPAPQLVKASTNPPPEPTSADPASAAPAGIMVQIAAISNPADAAVLVRALQRHGYTVSARRLPSDTLIHVQTGPFASKADAIAMRQKLLGDGYNAIFR
jgi:cell division septation protein DedD